MIWNFLVLQLKHLGWKNYFSLSHQNTNKKTFGQIKPNSQNLYSTLLLSLLMLFPWTRAINIHLLQHQRIWYNDNTNTFCVCVWLLHEIHFYRRNNLVFLIMGDFSCNAINSFGLSSTWHIVLVIGLPLQYSLS